MTRGLIAAALALAALLGAGWVGYRLGHGDAVAERQAAVDQLQDRLDEANRNTTRAEAARLAAQRARDALAQELEDAARTDPDADRPALSADSVRRLQHR